MDPFHSQWIRPLRVAENRFLEVLISRFSLYRQGQGTELHVRFDSNTPAIWTGDGKNYLRNKIPDFNSKASIYQHELDEFLLKAQGKFYEYNDPDFPFRYASGGALPVVSKGSKNYYCLFYRDIFPIGWNIANGGCDTRNELLNPHETMERELSEELIIVDPVKKKRYIFEVDAGKPLDRPEFSVARRFWDERFRDITYPIFGGLEELIIPLKWLDGPDILNVQIDECYRGTVKSCFININAGDFGIEIDNIARISLDEDVILLDGEVVSHCRLNRPVGLFEVDKLNQGMREGETEFFPDELFYDAIKYPGEITQHMIRDSFLPSLVKLRTAEEKFYYQQADKKYNLCPVTRSIINRYLSLYPVLDSVPIEPPSFIAFISYGGEDIKYAKAVFEHLQRNNIEAFFCEEYIENMQIIDILENALHKAKYLIGVATKYENLRRPWPKFELQQFYIDILNDRKENAGLISFISGFHPAYLPGPYRLYKAIEYDQGDMKPALDKLVKNILQ